MIHDWIVFDEEHQACRRCGLRLWRQGSAPWKAVTANGVPASHGLLPDGSRVACVPPTNLLVELVIIDYTGDPDRHPGCERFMHRIRGADEPGNAIVVPGAAPTACGFQPMGWEVGQARTHIGWTWCADCYPDRPRARGRLAPAAHVLRAMTPEPPKPKRIPKPKPRALCWRCGQLRPLRKDGQLAQTRCPAGRAFYEAGGPEFCQVRR
jgi:hypothetical protein